MATTFYPVSATGASLPSGGINMSSGTSKLLQITTRGSGSTTDTRNTSASPSTSWGNTFVCQFWGSDTTVTQDNAPASGTLVFMSNPLNSVTISGTVTANIRASESNVMANYGVGITVYRVTGNTTTRICYAADVTNELGTSDGAFSMSGTPTSTSLSTGDRLILLVGYHAQSAASSSGFTAAGTYSGASAAAAGDTSVTFTETITEQIFPPPTQRPRIEPQLAQMTTKRWWFLEGLWPPRLTKEAR